jgi:hypothetical protein
MKRSINSKKIQKKHLQESIRSKEQCSDGGSQVSIVTDINKNLTGHLSHRLSFFKRHPWQGQPASPPKAAQGQTRGKPSWPSQVPSDWIKSKLDVLGAQLFQSLAKPSWTVK